MANVQEWLDEKYPKEVRSSIIDLDISRQELEGNLKLEGFSKLEILTCHSNKLTGLNLSEAIQLEEIDCSNNLLTDVIFSLQGPKNLTNLECLDIEGTDVDSGLEYLPTQNLKEFCCAAIRKRAKVENIKNTLDLSEEEAKSAEKKISEHKINKIRNFQLCCL